MADERDEAPAVQKPRYRRPAPTIDLKATEVAVEPQSDSTSEAAAESFASAAPTAPDLAAHSEEAAPSSSADTQPETASAPDSGGMRQIPWPWTHAAAAAFGGLVALVIAASFWSAGILAPENNGALDRRVSRLEAQTKQIVGGAQSAMADAKTLDSLNARLAKLEQSIDAAAGAGGTATQPEGTAALDQAVKSLQAAVTELARRADDNAAATREARGRADAAFLAADGAQSAGQEKMKGSLEAIEKRVAALERNAKSLSDEVAKIRTPSADRSLRAAVAAQALRGAVERGDSYARELAALKPYVTDAGTLAPLEPFAKSGLPPAAVLAQELSALAPALQKSAEPPATGGFLDRLKTNAGRLVRIRPISDAPGSDPAAVLARAQSHAERGDIAGAVAEMEKLPAEARAAGDDWIKRAQARNAALTASRQLESDSLRALGEAAP